MSVLPVSEPRQREFLPEEFKLTVWSKLKPYYGELLRRSIQSKAELERWIFDWNELSALVSEEVNWRYINFSTDTRDEQAKETYIYAIQRILPKIKEVDQELRQKFLNDPHSQALDADQYFIYLRSLRNQIKLYRDENIPLFTEESLFAKTYGEITAQMLVEINGESMTLSKANDWLENADRSVREDAYRKIALRVNEDAPRLDDLFDDLIQKRHEIAQNTGFDNYRDYKFSALGRFDYTPADCMEFHESVRKTILPLVDEILEVRKEMLGLDELRPWDTQVDMDNQAPLQPYKTIEELISKTIQGLSAIHPYFGECLARLQEIGHLDLQSRPGKQQGGYNMPLPLSGVPFIFMNGTSSLKDVIVLSHESGHAVHSFLTRQYKINAFKRFPSEIAELAAMTMELLSMEQWEVFFDNKEELRRARFQQLSRSLRSLPWIMLIDRFQHWIYTHPEHTQAERNEEWLSLFKKYNSSAVDYSDMDDLLAKKWQRQLHLFEVPFYYIEYGMAQLGAIAIWKKYREEGDAAIQQFSAALELGYTKSVPEVYKAAGISFDFSEEYIQELAQFLRQELRSTLYEEVE